MHYQVVVYRNGTFRMRGQAQIGINNQENSKLDKTHASPHKVYHRPMKELCIIPEDDVDTLDTFDMAADHAVHLYFRSEHILWCVDIEKRIEVTRRKFYGGIFLLGDPILQSWNFA